MTKACADATAPAPPPPPLPATPQGPVHRALEPRPHRSEIPDLAPGPPEYLAPGVTDRVLAQLLAPHHLRRPLGIVEVHLVLAHSVEFPHHTEFLPVEVDARDEHPALVPHVVLQLGRRHADLAHADTAERLTGALAASIEEPDGPTCR